MESKSIGPLDLRQILDFAGRRIIAQEAYLNRLDAALGDGDHGITMRVGFQAIAHALSELDTAAGLDVTFRTAGMSFMGATGGAIGVIFGKMLMSCAGPLHGIKRFGTKEFKVLLSEMELAVSDAGKAKVGDKTILDALHAATLAMLGPCENDMELVSAVAKAAQAAETAAQDTAGMVCRVGRASHLGARALGHPDPGAVSLGIILKAMADWLTDSAATV